MTSKLAVKVLCVCKQWSWLLWMLFLLDADGSWLVSIVALLLWVLLNTKMRWVFLLLGTPGAIHRNTRVHC